MTLSDEQFENEFNVHNDKCLDTLAKVVKEYSIDNLDSLRIAGNVAKRVEEIIIWLNFSDSFRVENIPDRDIINLLDNIENRLINFCGSYYVIIRRLSDNKIMKRTVTDSN